MLSLQFHLRHLFGRIAQTVGPQRYSRLNRKLATLLGCTELPRRPDFVRLRPALRWASARHARYARSKRIIRPALRQALRQPLAGRRHGRHQLYSRSA